MDQRRRELMFASVAVALAAATAGTFANTPAAATPPTRLKSSDRRKLGKSEVSSIGSDRQQSIRGAAG
jgi:hypothetical protein